MNDKQTEYCSPRCAYTPRVNNHHGDSVLLTLSHCYQYYRQCTFNTITLLPVLHNVNYYYYNNKHNHKHQQRLRLLNNVRFVLAMNAIPMCNLRYIHVYTVHFLIFEPLNLEIFVPRIFRKFIHTTQDPQKYLTEQSTQITASKIEQNFTLLT